MNTCTCINECSLCLTDIGCLSIEGSTQNTTVANPLMSSGKIYNYTCTNVFVSFSKLRLTHM